MGTKLRWEENCSFSSLNGSAYWQRYRVKYEIHQKIHCTSYLLTLFLLFVILVKHSLSCLMCYKTHNISGMGMKLLRS